MLTRPLPIVKKKERVFFNQSRAEFTFTHHNYRKNRNREGNSVLSTIVIEKWNQFSLQDFIFYLMMPPFPLSPTSIPPNKLFKA